MSKHNFCCSTKQYYSQTKNLVETLIIVPRVIVCKKLMKWQEYEETITIKNKGMHPRNLLYSMDCAQDTKLIFPRNWEFDQLQPDDVIEVKVLITPTVNSVKTACRYIYIQSEHPNITFEIPIIALKTPSRCYMPKSIDFPSTVPDEHTYYEFVAFNPTSEPQTLAVKSSPKSIKITLSKKRIPPRDCMRILLTYKVSDANILQDVIKLKVENAFSEINIIHIPAEISLYISKNNLIFEELKYERESSQTFHVCNELPIDINCTIKFLTEQLEEEPSKSEKVRDRTSSYVSIFSTSNYHPIEEDDFSLVAYKHFNAVSKASIKGHGSIELTVRFHPVMLPECDFDNLSMSPHKVRTKLYIHVDDILSKYRESVNICGFIKGPEVEIHPKEIRLRKIYMGEEHCEVIKVLNVDGKVNAQVKFLDVIYPNTAGAIVEPVNGYTLEPCKSGIFRISFFAKVVGAFIVKLRFKVKNGDLIETTMKGQSIHARLKIFPDVLQFGVVPFGIPCKRLILLVNPFMVPVTVQVTVGDDGDETPLVLNVEDAHGLQPITVKDYVSAMLEMANDENGDNGSEENIIELISKSDSMLSYRSVSTVHSTCSSDFDAQILDAIPDFAFNIVSRIKENRYLEHKEAEECIVSEALEMLLSTNYFNSLKRFSNYAQMDWNVLPFNPKEVYCDKEVIYLLPNAGKSVTVILVPNRVGECNRALHIRICPINEEGGVEFGNTDAGWDLRGKFFVNSKIMTTKIWMEYVCRLPDISFTQEISYENDTIYVGQEVKFAMLFRNLSDVGGFFYYDIIPTGEDGEMIFKGNITKYFISPLGQTAVEGHLAFHRVGKIRLSGLIKIVGSLNGSPFHIYADVKPVKIRLESKTIYKRQKVLESTLEHFFIDNDTPTMTNFTMKLKNTKFQSIYPCGAILSPEGQGIYVTIFSKYYDADIYNNTLVIDIAEGTTNIEIPIIYVVEGSPIKMEPNIFHNSHDCGTLMINCHDIYETATPKYTKEVKLNNKGKHKYCFYIDKLRNNLAKCAIELRHGYVTVSPKVLCLEPQSKGTLYITADSCEAGTLYSEFRVRAIDQDNKLKVHTTRFAVTATFVEPEIHWCHKQVQMEYNRTHIYKEHPVLALLSILAMARLKNIGDVDCKVVLKVLGPFRIKQLFEHNLAKIITFRMKGLEEKEITIALHKGSIRDEFCSTVDGRILCEANSKPQRSLPLKLQIRSPELRLTQQDMVLFTRGMESLAYVEIRNISYLDAQYKWKKVEEKTDYVAEHDDTYQFSHDILSDILRMLDLDDSDSETNSLDERNMTLRYQKYRCKLEQLEDSIGVADIIDEIIDNIDLEHKRYAKLDDEDSTCLSPIRCSSGEFVRKTLNDVLSGLKLEDSYDVSQESIEECDEERKIHFVEKSGIIKKFTTIQSALFLPVVKPGYVKTATFVLDIVGSCPQQFDVTLINLERVMVFSSESVYLGVKPWYELFNATVRIINVTQYPITVSVLDKTVVDKTQRLYLGYAKIRGDNIFDICKFKSKLLKAEGIMGFSEHFIHEIQVTANASEEHIIHLRGQGIMPIISITTKLPHPEQTTYEILDEYELLQSIYYFDVFKSITEYDEDAPVAREEEDDASLLTTEYSVSTINTESTRSTTSSRQARFFRMMKSYVIVNNNGELPHARVLEQLIETQKFIKQLKENSKSVPMLRKVYQSYERMIHCYDEALPINLKHFTTQPLPFQQQGFVLNMNSMILGQLRKFQIDFNFYGPGKLIASVRTEVKIPGLYVDFEVKKRDVLIFIQYYRSKIERGSFGCEDHDYIFYAAEKKSASLFGKRYRNMFERVIDAEMNPKVKHAHSFDLDKREHHTRLEVGAKQRKELQNYYNSLNKSVYEEHKHHFTLCKIFSNSKTNYYSGEASILMLIKPEKQYYEEGQIIEDYLYIDLHLGPTVPILIRGLITKK